MSKTYTKTQAEATEAILLISKGGSEFWRTTGASLRRLCSLFLAEMDTATVPTNTRSPDDIQRGVTILAETLATLAK